MTGSTASDLYFVQEPVGEMANLAYVIARDTRSAARRSRLGRRVAARACGARRHPRGRRARHQYHQDHIGGSIFGMSIEGLARLMELSPMPVHVHAQRGDGVRRVTGLSASDLVAHEGGDEITLGGLRIRLPAHPATRPARSGFLDRRSETAAVVSGDTLF
jgi:hypothetical protein